MSVFVLINSSTSLIFKINDNYYFSINHNYKSKRNITIYNTKKEKKFMLEKNNKDNYNIELYNEEIKKLLSKFSLTDVVEIVHKLTGITKNKIYKWALKLKKS